MIKAIIFDFGSVLVGDEWRAIYKEIAQKLKIPEEKVKESSKPLLRKWSIGEIDEEKFWQEFEKQVGKKLAPEFTKDLWFRTYRDLTKNINGTWEILQELKTRGVRLAILSNTIPPHVRAHKKTGRVNKLKNLGFKIFVRSCEVGFRKPNPKIYQLTLKKLNLPSETCVFIDDKLVNIEVAKELGLREIHFQTPERLRKDLVKLGLLQ